MDDLRQQAIEILRHDVGLWDVRWDFLDGNGQVMNSESGTQRMEFVIADAVMQIVMDIPGLKQKSVTHRFFKPEEKALVWLSVDNHGDQWTFIEDFQNGISKSLPHSNADGTETWLQFKTLRETDNEVDVLMEMSTDNKTWVSIFRQYRVRTSS